MRKQCCGLALREGGQAVSNKSSIIPRFGQQVHDHAARRRRETVQEGDTGSHKRHILEIQLRWVGREEASIGSIVKSIQKVGKIGLVL
jgi:hypothetical protein